MFNLEEKISEWCQQMLAAGIKTPVPLEELENHLREEIERQMQSGKSAQQSFEMSATVIGQSKPLKTEFKKIDAENWNRSFAWAAWILFAVSFFLPAHQWVGRGWKCALMSSKEWVSSEFWQGFLHTKNAVFSEDFHLASLTLANALMIFSPFLILRFANGIRFRKWFGISTFIALVLVWSYIGLWLSGGSSDLKIGCYIWGISFLPLWLCALKTFRRQTFATKYV